MNLTNAYASCLRASYYEPYKPTVQPQQQHQLGCSLDHAYSSSQPTQAHLHHNVNTYTTPSPNHGSIPCDHNKATARKE